MSVFIEENHFLRSLTSCFSRSERQLNALLECDAELIRLRDGLILAVTTDGIVEEIESHLYEDPYLMGWMVAVINLSDLAAVGASPLGLLLIENLPASLSQSFIERLQQGIEDACKTNGVCVIGGDTNTSSTLQLSATGVGLVEDQRTIMRTGCKAGDMLYATGLMGAGNAFAFSRLLDQKSDTVFPYKPMPRLAEGALIRQFGSSCIDTSDGFFAALANLIELNDIGVTIDMWLHEIVDPNAKNTAYEKTLPPWYFLAGPHGEFELLYTIPPDRNKPFLEACDSNGWRPVRLGTVNATPGLYLKETDDDKAEDLFRISNLFMECKGNPEQFFYELQRISL